MKKPIYIIGLNIIIIVSLLILAGCSNTGVTNVHRRTAADKELNDIYYDGAWYAQFCTFCDNEPGCMCHNVEIQTVKPKRVWDDQGMLICADDNEFLEECPEFYREIESGCDIPYGKKYAVYGENMDWKIKIW